MVKRKEVSAGHNSHNLCTDARSTVLALRQDTDLCYRIRVLLYDLSNIANDSFSERRLSSTTHPLYISEPYFTASEAAGILNALVDDPASIEATHCLTVDHKDTSASSPCLTVEETISQTLANFFDKRRASGDARPCGPHDMVPIYAGIFGIQKDELRNESFLSRLRRSGLGNVSSKNEPTVAANGSSDGKGKKKGGKGK